MGERRFSGTFLRVGKPEGRFAASDGNASAALARNISALTPAGVEQVLHYRIDAKLGEGGMGVVYKAIDQKLNRLVALKFLPLQMEHSSVDVKRFVQEASALSALNHPHIATIFAVETAGEQPFLALEYLPGGTLKAKLRQTYGSGAALSFDDIYKYACQTAAGLAHAHSRGIIHRDVKTSNLMLTEGDDVKITDFGVAKLSGSSLATTPGSFMGTIAYMSPEQALGMDVDARSDVFSFGVSLFELITGRLPFEAPNDAALITKVASARAPELKAARSDVPAGLERVVQRALKKRVEERYQSMDDVLAELQAPADRALTQTRVKTTVRPLIARSPKRRLPLVAGSALLLAAIFSGVFWSRSRPARPYELPVDKQVAVLRFRNLSGDPLHQPFCDGLTELLSSKLSQLGQFPGSLVVVAASDVLGLEVRSARAARKEFGANLVVDGSVERMLDRILVHISLVDTAKLTILAARDVELASDQASEFQDLLLEKIAEMLKVPFKTETRRALAAGLPAQPGAYAFYLQGRGHLQRYDRLENLDQAIDFFQRALSHDPSYALAYAGLAEAFLRKYGATKNTDLIHLAQESGQRAILQNDGLAPVHYAMGLIYQARGEYEHAIESFERSIKIHLEPNAYRELANAYDALNKIAEAEGTYRRAIQMQPTYWAGYRDLAAFYQSHGKLDDALPLFQTVVELTPDNYAGHANLGGAYLRLGMTSQAIEHFERAISIKPTGATYNNLGVAFYMQGKYREAIEMYRKAIQLVPNDARSWGALADAYRYVPSLDGELGFVYARAIELTEKELTINPNDQQKRARIATWLITSDRQRALKQIREALRFSPQDNVVQSRAALVYEQSGMREEALAAVKSAIDLGFPVAEIESWPPLAELRQDPRYRAIFQKRSPESSAVSTSNN